VKPKQENVMANYPEDDRPTKVEMLAALVTGNASVTATMASVQRSHRFPLHLFTKIENMARMGGVPVSLVINELLDLGIDTVMKELTAEEAEKVRIMRPEQTERPMVTDRVNASGRRYRTKAKSGKQK
jgi:hypothetical protein